MAEVKKSITKSEEKSCTPVRRQLHSLPKCPLPSGRQFTQSAKEAIEVAEFLISYFLITEVFPSQPPGTRLQSSITITEWPINDIVGVEKTIHQKYIRVARFVASHT